MDRLTPRVTLDLPDKPAQLWIGRVDTGHYLFEALGATEEEAGALLLAAYAEHVRQMPAGQADPTLMQDYVLGEEVSWTVMTVGQAARDGEVIVERPDQSAITY